MKNEERKKLSVPGDLMVEKFLGIGYTVSRKELFLWLIFMMAFSEQF